MGRCAVLIDGGYLNKVCDNEYNRPNLHFGLLSDDVVGATSTRLRTYYYHCMPYQSNPPTPDEQQRHRAMSQFIYNLEKMPRFQFRQGKLQKIQGVFRQKRGSCQETWAIHEPSPGCPGMQRGPARNRGEALQDLRSRLDDEAAFFEHIEQLSPQCPEPEQAINQLFSFRTSHADQ